MFSEQLYDWIVPEVATASGQPVQFDIVSTNFAQQTYDSDALLAGRDTGGRKDRPTPPILQTAPSRNSLTLFSSSDTKTILITGGQNENSTTLSSAEKLDTSSNDVQLHRGQ